MLHPFMPFVSEELWQRLPRRKGQNIESICIAPYPTGNSSWRQPELESSVEQVLEIVRGIRSIRAGYKLAHKNLTAHYVQAKNDHYRQIVTSYQSILQAPTLAFSASVTVLTAEDKFPESCSIKEVSEFCTVGVVIPADTAKLAPSDSKDTAK